MICACFSAPNSEIKRDIYHSGGRSLFVVWILFVIYDDKMPLTTLSSRPLKYVLNVKYIITMFNNKQIGIEKKFLNVLAANI